MRYPTTPASTEHLFLLSVRYAWQTLQQIFFPILIFVVLKSIFTHLPGLPRTVGITLGCIIAFVTIFLWVLALLRADAAWQGAPLTWGQTWRKALQGLDKVYLACLLLALLLAAIFFFGRWLIGSVLHMHGVAAGATMLLGIAVPLILIILFGYLTLPLLALEERYKLFSIGRAFVDSVVLTQQRFLMLVVLYAEIVILLVISSTHSRHGVWLLSHYLMEVVDLTACSVIMPLFINLTLLIVHSHRAHISD